MSPFKKRLFNILGIICLVAGIINAFIPGLPTTPFLILASMLFSGANPKLQAWLLRNRITGPYLDNYYHKRGMAIAYKIRSCAFMWGGMIFAMTLLGLLWVRVVITAIGIAVSIHLFTAKTQKPPPGQYGFWYNMISLLLAWLWFALALIISVKTTMGYLVVGGVALAFTIGMLIYAALSSREGKIEEQQE